MQLNLKSGPLEGLSFELDDRPVTIGRHPESILVLDDHNVSRNHAVIEPTPETNTFVLRDLGSTNKTYLNDSEVTTAVLKPGDVIRIGASVLELGQSPGNAHGADGAILTLDLCDETLPRILGAPASSKRLAAPLFEITGSSDPEQALEVITRAIHCSHASWVTEADQERPQFSGVDPAEVLADPARILKEARETCRAVIVRGAAPHGSVAVIPVLDPQYPATLLLVRPPEVPAFPMLDLECAVALANQLHRSSTRGTLVDPTTDRLASLGRIASSFAHDLNSPLSSLLGFIELCDRLVTREVSGVAAQKLRGFLHRAQDSAEFCRSLSRNVLDFARSNRDSSRDRPFGLAQAVQQTLAICDGHLRESGTEIDVKIPEDLQLFGDPTQLQQVVINLVTNAVDALRENDGGAGSIRIHAREEGPETVLEVEDNGPGIPEHLQSRVFEALFTTRSESDGTGLGLYVVDGLVRHMHGRIDLHSESGAGTRFTISLPSAPRELTGPQETPSHDIEKVKGGTS